MVDITASKKADEILKESQRKYHICLKESLIRSSFYDREQNCSWTVNKAVERVYGYSKDELLRMTPFDRISQRTTQRPA